MFEVSEKPRRVERAFLVSVVRHKEEEARAFSLLDELKELVENLGIEVKPTARLSLLTAGARYGGARPR